MRHRTQHSKYFRHTTDRCRIVAFALASASVLAFTARARADCWPPLNAVEERQSNPLRIGKETFTTGYYSWTIEGYRVDDLHCEETINEGPRQWSVIVGQGGDEPIGPRVTTDGKASQSTSVPANTRARQSTAPTTPLPSLPSLPPTPALPTTLPNLPPPAGLAPLAP